MAKDPSSLIRVIADGAQTPQAQETIPFMMPGYKGVLSDKEMSDVVNYVRGSWGKCPCGDGRRRKENRRGEWIVLSPSGKGAARPLF